MQQKEKLSAVRTRDARDGREMEGLRDGSRGRMQMAAAEAGCSPLERARCGLAEQVDLDERVEEEVDELRDCLVV